MRAAAVAPGVSIARVEFDGLIEVGYGLGKAPLLGSRFAAIVPGSGIARIDLNRFTEIVYRRVVLSPPGMDNPAIEIGVGKMRIQLNGVAVVDESPCQVAFTIAGEA